MKLRRLFIDRMPGIDRPFELDDLGEGLNIVVGPNGIGKSQVCAAVRALLWHERGMANELTARAIFSHEGESWSVLRDHSLHAWQRDGVDVKPPILPGEQLDGCFFLGLRDLLDDSDRAGRDLASEIRRQMSGGFDLDEVDQHFRDSIPARTGSRENKDLAAAESEIRRAERSQAEVERRERELESLEREAADAARASRRLNAVQMAISLHAVRSDLSQKRLELAKLPPALANLDGKETLRLDKLEEEIGDKQRERRASDLALTASREAVHATRLEEPIDARSLGSWRERVEELADLERQLAAAEIDRRKAFATVAERRAPLGARVDPASDAELDDPMLLDDDFDLFTFLRESQRLATESEAVNERLRLLVARNFGDDESRRLELLKRSIPPLRDWLRAPDPGWRDGNAAFWPSRSALMLVGSMFVATGLGIQFGIETVPGIAIGLSIGVGLGLIVAGFLSRVRVDLGDSPDWRLVAGRQFPEAVDPPTRWTTEAVGNRLRELEDELATLDASEKRSRDRLVERGQLEENLNGIGVRARDLDDRRRRLFARLGLDSQRPDIELVELALGLDALRAARVEAQRAEAEARELTASRDRCLEALSTPLVELGESGPIDVASTRAAVQSLVERDRRLRDAISDGRREEASRDRLDREIDGLENGRSEIYTVAGIESHDRAELTRVLGELDRHRELRSQSAELAGRLERATTDLAACGETRLAEQGLERLADEKAILERSAEGRDDLISQIAEIKQRARDAREGFVLEEAIAKKNDVLRALGDRREEALAALAGQFLIDGVRSDHETNQMPRVLENARERFGAFTHHRYELKVSANDGGSFVAIDGQSGRGLRPEQLSDGTRAQLILAARLAFAEEAEQGADLPLFLDEAMDHSDPERFHAIACSLARMVKDDARQVFYLSNDPTDIERFQMAFDEVGCQQLKTIDLGEIRGRSARIDGPEALRVEKLASVPAPDGIDAASYGVAIGVGPLEPRDDLRSHHLYYVLYEDLDLLHELLVARIESVGQWINLAGGNSSFARKIVERGAAGVGLDARIDLLETYCLAWREGRGRKVGRRELEKSGAVTEKFIDALVEIVKNFDGDASRLMTALRERTDERLSGFRRKSTEELQRYFEKHVYVDEKPILDESEIVERALATPAANRLSPRVAAEFVHQWWGLTDKSG